MTTEPEPQEQSSRGLITALAIFAGVVIVIIYGYLAKPGWVGSSGKQFWDYLDLLIVPAALALGVYWLNRRQTVRDQQAEQAQQERALAVESQRAQDDALQAYLEAMSNLITEHRLRTSQPSNDQDRNAAPEPLTEDEDVTPSSDNDVRAVAQARTLTVLMTLSSGDRDVAIGAGVRKGSVLQFLYDAGLITGHPPPWWSPGPT